MIIPHYGIDWWDESIEKALFYPGTLTLSTTGNQFLFITYTIIIKRANPRKRICPIEKTISQIM